jgi:hypothetical protein
VLLLPVGRIGNPSLFLRQPAFCDASIRRRAGFHFTLPAESTATGASAAIGQPWLRDRTPYIIAITVRQPRRANSIHRFYSIIQLFNWVQLRFLQARSPQPLFIKWFVARASLKRSQRHAEIIDTTRYQIVTYESCRDTSCTLFISRVSIHAVCVN